MGAAAAAVVVVLDQVTKLLAERGLEPGERVDVLGYLFGLRLYYNPGAAFSLGTSATPLLTVFATAASVAMVVALVRTTRPAWGLAVGVLLGGALGNLTDRLLRPPGFARGEVVDFFQLPSFPIFNVADVGVVTGAALVVLLSLRDVPFRDGEGSGDGEGAGDGDGAADRGGAHVQDGSGDADGPSVEPSTAPREP
ncbi:signal peptidase II [Aquipuribacter sp. SD81]|uniref:signal peptidase II n=1 Tax=Aquipuribacter sp. SD81 TaxID=3127703 RepID=UPI00301A0BB2